jgi:hypothetical protein
MVWANRSRYWRASTSKPRRYITGGAIGAEKARCVELIERDLAGNPFRPAGMTGERGMLGPRELQSLGSLGQRSSGDHRPEAGDEKGESLRIHATTGC